MRNDQLGFTKPDSIYPGYVNLKMTNGVPTLTVRADPKVVDGVYVCGYERDRGQPGRCVPGDDRCNNYCNADTSKPMPDKPARCQQVICGVTAEITLQVDDLRAFLNAASKLAAD